MPADVVFSTLANKLPRGWIDLRSSHPPIQIRVPCGDIYKIVLAEKAATDLSSATWRFRIPLAGERSNLNDNRNNHARAEFQKALLAIGARHISIIGDIQPNDSKRIWYELSILSDPESNDLEKRLLELAQGAVDLITVFATPICELPYYR